jgi:L-ribulose-5-phosphate 3-epimerase
VNDRIGFMQGRLSPIVGGRIQAFPWDHWRDEFRAAQNVGLRLMEWTLDQQRLGENPLLTGDGQAEIHALCARHDVAIPSLTGDCFMHAPFWKVEGTERAKLADDFRFVADACAAIGISIIVVPLVDNGRVESSAQEDVIVRHLTGLAGFLSGNGLRVAFESDYSPAELSRFIERFDPELFGINYDMGNSAAAGFDVDEELDRYGHRITNVHVKDRMRGGTTVPLGTGNVDFPRVFGGLREIHFRGNFILQTARAADGDDAGALTRYRAMTTEWLSSNGS